MPAGVANLLSSWRLESILFAAPAVSETKQALTEDFFHGYFVNGKKASMCLNATLLSLVSLKARTAQWWGNQGCVPGKQGLQFAWCRPGADCNYGLHAQRGVCRPSVLLLKKPDISTHFCPGFFCSLFFFQR